jgi:hypothetical protein
VYLLQVIGQYCAVVRKYGFNQFQYGGWRDGGKAHEYWLLADN